MHRKLIDRLVFSLIVCLLLVPVWAFHYFPSQDGPAHLANAVALRALLTGEEGIFQRYFVLNPMVSANWLSHLLLAGLLSFLPPTGAEKLLLSLCVAGLPFAARLALRAMKSDGAWLAILTVPFIYSFTFHMGFYSFSLGLPLFFIYLALHLRWRTCLSAWRLVALFLVGAVLYLAHMLTFDFALLVVGFVECWSLFLGWRQGRLEARQPGDGWKPLRRLFLALVPLLPGALFQISFAFGVQTGAVARPRPGVIPLLTHLSPFVSFRPEERWPGILVQLLFLGLVLCALVIRWRQPSASPWDGILLAALALMLLSFLAPNQVFGGGQITVRLLLAMFLCLALWLGVNLGSGTAAYMGGFGAALLALAALAIQVPVYGRFNQGMREYASAASHMEEGRTLLALNLAGRGRDTSGQPLSIRVRPFKHADGYLAAERRGVMLRNYEPHAGHFPLLFRPQVDPWARLGNFEGRPLSFDYENYIDTTPARIDYFLLSPGELLSSSERARQFQAVLAEQYDRIHVSEPRQLVYLYKRR